MTQSKKYLKVGGKPVEQMIITVNLPQLESDRKHHSIWKRLIPATASAPEYSVLTDSEYSKEIN